MGYERWMSLGRYFSGSTLVFAGLDLFVAFNGGEFPSWIVFASLGLAVLSFGFASIIKAIEGNKEAEGEGKWS